MSTTFINKTRITSLAAAVAVLGLAAIRAQGQSVVYTFSDGTSDGWANTGFGTTPVASVSSIGGQNYIAIPLGSFQAASVQSGAPGNLPTFNAAMAAAALNPAGYDISYNYYINTAGFSGATFLQVGTYVNSGSGYYAQDYGAPNELQLNGTQLASGQIFTGTITVNMAAIGYAIPPADTFFRLGLIENGNGTGVVVDYTDISVAPVPTPEPATLSLFGIGALGLWQVARRRKA
jgi:PEP-CTERM motif